MPGPCPKLPRTTSARTQGRLDPTQSSLPQSLLSFVPGCPHVLRAVSAQQPATFALRSGDLEGPKNLPEPPPGVIRFSYRSLATTSRQPSCCRIRYSADRATLFECVCSVRLSRRALGKTQRAFSTLPLPLR